MSIPGSAGPVAPLGLAVLTPTEERVFIGGLVEAATLPLRSDLGIVIGEMA